MPPPRNELQEFKEAIAWAESRGWKQMGFRSQYETMGDDRGSRYGVARGKYQIMSEIWPGWAAAAGYGRSANWRDPRVQEAVADHRMSYYYDRYNGRWDLVAAAWFSGVGNADEAYKHGINVLSGVNDSGNKPGSGTNVPSYVQSVISRLGSGTSSKAGPRSTQSLQGLPEGDRLSMEEMDAQPVYSAPRAIAQQVMLQASRLVSENPGNEEVRSRINQALSSLYNYRQEPTSFAQAAPDEPTMPSSAPTPSSSGGRGVKAAAPSPVEPAPEAPTLTPPVVGGKTSSRSGVV